MLWWILGYFLIGLIASCAIQYYKGRASSPNSTDIVGDMQLDLLSATVFALWPGVIMLAVAVGLIILIGLPLIKLSELCSNLGKKHRKVTDGPVR